MTSGCNPKATRRRALSPTSLRVPRHAFAPVQGGKLADVANDNVPVGNDISDRLSVHAAADQGFDSFAYHHVDRHRHRPDVVKLGMASVPLT